MAFRCFEFGFHWCHSVVPFCGCCGSKMEVSNPWGYPCSSSIFWIALAHILIYVPIILVFPTYAKKTQLLIKVIWAIPNNKSLLVMVYYCWDYSHYKLFIQVPIQGLLNDELRVLYIVHGVLNHADGKVRDDHAEARTSHVHSHS